MARQHKRRSRPPTIPKARIIRPSPLTRIDVRRGEFDRLIRILNERNAMLNALRDAVQGLERASEVQFKRIAQMQAELDQLKRDRERQLAS